MEIKPEMLELDDWEKLEETADTIIANATRDLILWDAVLKEVKKQKEKCLNYTPKEEEKNISSAEN